MEGNRKIMKKRLLFILAFFTIFILALFVRIFWIQIVDGSWYRNKATAQLYESQAISPKRGEILDRNYKKLAVNVPADTISVDPVLVKTSKMDVVQITQGISKILQIDQKDLLEKFHADSQYEVIKRKTEKDVSNSLKKWIRENKINGIYFSEEEKRVYPNQNLAAQVIGFTGTDNQGLAGIELKMEKYLVGRPGKVSQYVDARGQKVPFGEETSIDAQDGLDIVLTIDEVIQAFAEKTLQEAIEDNKVLQGGTAIVMDPRNGDILAMVSKPDFNLNDPFAQNLQENVWTNKAVSSTYEPGSIFKSITAAAALEDGIITPGSMVVDSPVKVAGWTIRSMTPGGHGTETFRKSVYNSDNPVFVKLAMTLGIEKFYNYVKAFGFYDKTEISLPGEAGSIFQKEPREIDMATASFGQSFRITPIQMITAYTAIENGGKLLKPRLVKEITDSSGNVVEKFEPEIIRNVISSKTSDTLKDILEGVVAEGTGNHAYIRGYRIAGKTATAETFVNGKRSSERYVASFAGFAPADNPVISVLVMLDHPTAGSYYGGQVSAPVAAKIIEFTLDYLGVQKEYTEKEKAQMAKEAKVLDKESDKAN